MLAFKKNGNSEHYEIYSKKNLNCDFHLSLKLSNDIS